MPRCTICTHPERDKIDATLLRGVGLKPVAKKYGLSKSSVARHQAKCVRNELVALTLDRETAGREAREGNPFGELERLQADAHRIRRRAEKAGNFRDALAAIAQLTRIIELLCKLRGDLQPAASTVNVAVAVAGTETGGHLVAKLSSLIAGARERQLPANTEPATSAGEAEGEVITVEQAR
jgi:hypothetical protein